MAPKLILKKYVYGREPGQQEFLPHGQKLSEDFYRVFKMVVANEVSRGSVAQIWAAGMDEVIIWPKRRDPSIPKHPADEYWQKLIEAAQMFPYAIEYLKNGKRIAFNELTRTRGRGVKVVARMELPSVIMIKLPWYVVAVRVLNWLWRWATRKPRMRWLW